MKKRLMAIVLTVGVVLSLVGCGGETTSNEVSQVEETVAEATEEVVEQAEEVATPEPTAEPTPEPTPEVVLDAFTMAEEVSTSIDKFIADGKGYTSTATYTSLDEQWTSVYFAYDDMYLGTSGGEVNGDNFLITDTKDEKVYFRVDGEWYNSVNDYQESIYSTAYACCIHTALKDKSYQLEVYSVDPITGEELDDYIFTQITEFDVDGSTVTVMTKTSVDKETMLPKVMVIERYKGKATIETADFEMSGESAFFEREEYVYEYFDETSENWEEFTSLFMIPEESIDYDAFTAE